MPVAENATQVIIFFKMAKFLHKVAAGRVSEYNCIFHEKKASYESSLQEIEFNEKWHQIRCRLEEIHECPTPY